MTYLIALALLLIATPAFALQANLSWTAPVLAPTDPVPTNILVQTAATAAGPFTTLHTLPTTATTDSDATIVMGTQKCYQVVWVYALGNSSALGPLCATPSVGPKGTNFQLLIQP